MPATFENDWHCEQPNQKQMYSFYTKNLCKPPRYITKLLLIMRLTTIILITAILQVSASSFAQKITLSEKNAPIVKIFEKIRTQSGYDFMFSLSTINDAKPVTINVQDAELKDVLKQIFVNQPLEYRINEKSVVISPKEPSLLDKLSTVISNIVRDLTVKGRVVDQEGRPLPNASIRVKGKSAVTNTNQNGEFEIKGVDEDAVLLVSYVGFKTLELPLKGAVIPLEIKLNVATGELEEVKVTYNTGYQELNKERATGSFVQIDNKLLNRAVGRNLLERIDGLASGVLFNKTQTIGNNQSDISIRSRATIFANPNPLIVVDNFPYDGELNNLNPNDIQNITILKDAAAAALWGAYSGNGVIVITTKKGKLNQAPSISFTSNLTVGEKPNLYYQPILESKDYIDLETFLFSSGNYAFAESNIRRPVLSPVVELLIKKRDKVLSEQEVNAQLEGLKQIDLRESVEKHFYRKSIFLQNSLNISGGGENQIYYLSFGNDYTKSTLIGDNDKRYTFTGRNTFSFLKKKLNLSTSLVYTHTLTKNNGISQVAYPYPYLSLTDANGNVNILPNTLRQSYKDGLASSGLLDWNYRPLDELSLNDNQRNLTDFQMSMGLKYSIIQALNLEISYQYSNGNSENKRRADIKSYGTRDYINSFTSINPQNNKLIRAVPLGDILDEELLSYSGQYARTQLNYNKIINNHGINAIIGFDTRDIQSVYSKDRLYGYNKDTKIQQVVNYLTDYPLFIVPGSTDRILSNRINRGTTDRYISYYLNAVYSYFNKYTFSVSARKDASNIFGVKSNEKGVPLWSAGALWNINKESFYTLNWLPILKFRITNGYTGNVDRTLTSTMTSTAQGALNSFGAPQATLRNPPNERLRWERVNILNFGIEFQLKDKVVSGAIEYYRKNAKDLIGTAPFDPTSGVSTFTGNNSNMKGEGFDVNLETINTNGKLKWTTNALFSFVKDQVTDYKIKPNSISNMLGQLGSVNPILGRPLYSIYAFEWNGLSHINGDPIVSFNGKPSTDYLNLYTSNNLNNLKFMGRSTPAYFGSFRNTIEMFGFSMSANIIYKLGYYYRRNSIQYESFFSEGNRIGHRDFNLRWKNPGDEVKTNVPSLKYPGDSLKDAIYGYSSILVDNASHIRLQDIKVSYQLISPNNNSSILKSMAIYLYANNLGILWRQNKNSIDPDVVNGTPSPKSYSIGLSMNL